MQERLCIETDISGSKKLPVNSGINKVHVTPFQSKRSHYDQFQFLAVKSALGCARYHAIEWLEGLQKMAWERNTYFSSVKYISYSRVHQSYQLANSTHFFIHRQHNHEDQYTIHMAVQDIVR